MGTIGRQSGHIRLEVCQGTTQKELDGFVLQNTLPLSVVNTDEWKGYGNLEKMQRVHRTVNHGQREWARDDDDDGIREVHTNTIEGLWTGVRNFLRTFRGVAKWNLYHYCAVHEWRNNTKQINTAFVKALCWSYNEIPI